MNAEELFEISKGGRKVGQSGLSIRVENCLYRAGGYSNTEDGERALSREKIMAAVLDGSIWQGRNIGEKTVKEICEWLASVEIDNA